MPAPSKKKIWIDLENSPHVPFFKPIIEELNKRGYQTVLTARDFAQTCSLADLFQMKYRRIGRHYGKYKIFKLVGLVLRVLQLMPLILKERPALALSHGSRSQIILATLLRIRSVETMDYEHAQMTPLTQPDWLIVPEVICADDFNLDKGHILKYPGIKEDIYVPGFTSGASIKQELKIRKNDIVVTIRPPATEAHYFVPESAELFTKTVEYLARRENVRMIILPRNEKQGAYIRKTWPGLFSMRKIIIPDKVVDGLNLLWHSDVVISGGGTMNREAAALGVPVYSIFRGKIGAVDRYLADSGRLVILESSEDIRSKIVLERRHQAPRTDPLHSTVLKNLVDQIVDIAEGNGQRLTLPASV